MARIVVSLTRKQIECLLGAVDFAEAYIEDAEGTHGSLTRDESVTRRVLNNAAEALREGLHR